MTRTTCPRCGEREVPVIIDFANRELTDIQPCTACMTSDDEWTDAEDSAIHETAWDHYCPGDYAMDPDDFR